MYNPIASALPLRRGIAAARASAAANFLERALHEPFFSVEEPYTDNLLKTDSIEPASQARQPAKPASLTSQPASSPAIRHASQPASKPASQAASQQASQPASQRLIFLGCFHVGCLDVRCRFSGCCSVCKCLWVGDLSVNFTLQSLTHKHIHTLHPSKRHPKSKHPARKHPKLKIQIP